MHLCMRTTIDIPDSLLRRAKNQMHKQKTTFRALVITALEKSLSQGDAKDFRLRDAAVGKRGKKTVSAEAINRTIDKQRNQDFRA